MSTHDPPEPWMLNSAQQAHYKCYTVILLTVMVFLSILSFTLSYTWSIKCSVIIMYADLDRCHYITETHSQLLNVLVYNKI